MFLGWKILEYVYCLGERSCKNKELKQEKKKVLQAEKFCNTSFLKRKLLRLLKAYLKKKFVMSIF